MKTVKQIHIFLISEPLESILSKIISLEGVPPLSWTEASKDICKLKHIGDLEVEEIPNRGEIIILESQKYLVRYLDWNYPHFGQHVAVWVDSRLSL